MNDGTHTDDWCRQRSNNIPPIYAMQGHSAVDGLTFYYSGTSVVSTLFCSLPADR
jgi:glucose/arabinose dehydrogenase